ncbi:MAG: hypothetical protein IJ848_03715 [Alphaproteobacteria bacterium]|nr:hypothetical protein [Alphaproteobacteria bacterium]
MADKVPMYIQNSLPKYKLKKIIYSSGPLSFTTLRVINSIIKGIKIVNKEVEFVGVSNFLTYLSLIEPNNTEGLIAIPTYRGDYFTCTYDSKRKLSDISICNLENFNNVANKLLLTNDISVLFKNRNLAQQQFKILYNDISFINKKFIKFSTEVIYNITPIFKKISQSEILC